MILRPNTIDGGRERQDGSGSAQPESGAIDTAFGWFLVYQGERARPTIGATAGKEPMMGRRTWIVIGSLTGLVAGPALVAVTGVLLGDPGGLAFRDQGVPALVISGSAGVVLGAFVTSRVAFTTPRRTALLGTVCGTFLGAAAMGSLFLAAEVAGDDWPQGLSAFLTGAILGAVVGGILGGALGFAQGGIPAAGRPPRPFRPRHTSDSLRDVR